MLDDQYGKRSDDTAIRADGVPMATPPGRIAITSHLAPRPEWVVKQHAAAPLQRKASMPPVEAAPHLTADEEYITAMHFASPVQCRAAAAPAPSADVHCLAAQGTTAGVGAMPFAERIKASFGTEHAPTIDRIRAHQGTSATDAATAMGAEAYATGSSVVFGAAPTLHTAAHEAAHVVQQRAGVSLSGGVGQAGDAYERHADAVADRVVAGESAEDLLASRSSSASTSTVASVQRKAPSAAKGNAAVGAGPGRVRWTVGLQLGGRGASMARSHEPDRVEAFVGDSLFVNAHVRDVADDSVPRLTIALESNGETAPAMEAMQAGSATPGITTTVVTLRRAGRGTLRAQLTVGDEAPVEHSISIAIFDDAGGILDSATQALAMVATRYAAAEARFDEAALNYDQAYARHQAVLSRVEAAQRARDAAIMAIVFAGVAGPVGGLVGGLLKPWLDSATVSKLARGVASDTVKDLYKATATQYARLAWADGEHGSHGGTEPSLRRAGGGRATGTAGELGHGRFAAAAGNPHAWYLTAKMILAEEQAAANELLTEIIASARRSKDDGTNDSYALDPLTIVEQRCTIDGRPMDQLARPPTDTDYELALWAAWLQDNAIEIQHWHVQSHGDYWDTDHAVPLHGGLRAAVGDELESLGQDAEAWFRAYGA